MPITYLSDAVEESTKVIPVAFRDESGASVTPKSIQWTLTDANGTVINSRSAVVETPASTINIVLSGNDLAIGVNGAARRLYIYALYDSTYGTDLPLRDSAAFEIRNIIAIT